MNMDNVIGNQSIIITLDVDGLLMDKLQQLYQSGFSVVELNRVEPSLIKKVMKAFPNLRVGAGNVVSVKQLEECYEAGVHFMTSPGFVPSLVQTAQVYSINFLPGVATVSEAMEAMLAGCQHVRPYPAKLSFCTLLNKCFPSLRLFPAEIEWDETEHFLNLPSVVAVSLVNPEIKQLQALDFASAT